MLNRLKSSFRIFKKNNKSIGSTTAKIPQEMLKATAPISKEKTGIKAQLKKYGKVGLISYTIGYLAGFLGFYTAVQYNIIKVDYIKNLTKDTFVDRYMSVNEKLEKADPKHVKVVTAFLMNEMFDIVRIPLLLVFLKVITKK
jgi:hypothetical protein